MASIALTLKNADEQTIAQYGLESGRLEQIEAINGAYYQFIDAATGTGPVRIDTARSGDDLLLSFNGSSSTDLVIKDYFARGEGALIGFQANGEIYHYPVITAPEHLLAETLAAPSAGVATPAALGAVAAVAVLAGGIAIATHNHDKHDNHRDNALQPHSPDTPDNTGNPPSPPNQNPGNNTNPLLPPGPNQPNPNNPNPNNPNPNNPNPNNPQPAPNKAGTVTIQGEAKVGSELTAKVDDADGVDTSKVKYQWLANGVAIAGATGSSYQLTAAEVGKTITVRATYTDNAQHSEAPTSAATNPVVDPANPNPNPNPQPQPQPNHEGSVTISGDAKVGETLTAKVDDADGVPNNVQYQWLANGVAIAGATGSSYQLTAAEAGKTITVRATYTDNAQHSEAPISTATAPVVDPANPNPQPPQPPANHEGKVSITGDAKVGETLTAKVDDADGVPNNVQYQWLANGVAIAGATGSSYQLTAAEAGKTISVRATYTDNAQHSEAPTSATTSAVVDPANPNPNPNPQPPQPQPNHEGTVTISGDAKVGETLTATVTDDDGVPANVTYQWLANGVAIAGATGSSYQLTAAEAGKTITVRATYTDNAQHSEAPISTATAPVVDPANPNPNPNPQPQPNHEGDVAISGNAKVGETLTAEVHDADQFDESKVSYQWLRDGKEIAGANSKIYTLTADDEGHKVSVKAEYTDNAGNKESHDAESGVVQPQTSTNHAPTDIQLSASEVAEGKDGATVGKLTTTDPNAGDQHTYKVSDDRFEVTADGTLKLKDGKHLDFASEPKVTLQVTSDDGHGGTYNKTFTLQVQDDPNYPPVNPNPNPQPQPNHAGTVSITGEAKVGSELKAAVKDDDGFDSANVKYQWLRDGQKISGAEGESYRLTADDVGHKISVQATYKDKAQHDESPTSAQTDAVTDGQTPPNPQPPQPQPNHAGTVSISGEAKVGSELKAAVKDGDGFDSANVKYQWLRDGQKISGAEGESYRLTADDVGHKISVQATYKDKAQHDESPTSAQTDAVTDGQTPPNPQPQPNHAGTVSISGEAKVGSELKAAVNDDDGFDSANVKYQWLRDGQKISGAEGESYKLTADDVGHKISVQATYDDNGKNHESPTSAQTDAVTDGQTPPNPQPPQPQPNHAGTVSISGEAKVGSELKAAVNDDDGFDSASVKYQWLRDGQKISGAEGESYKLTADDVGHKISVQATYDDNAKNHESPTSAQTDSVSDNTPPPPPQPNEPGITLTGAKEVTEGGKATYTVSLDNRALPQANSASELLHNLQSHKGILFGQQRGLDVSFSPENSEGHHSDIHALTNHYPSIIGLGMMEPPMVRGLSNEENGKRMGEAIKKIDSVGGIAQLSAFWDMPGGESDRTKVDLKRLLPGGDQNAELNGWLDAIVETGKHALRDDGTKIPFIFRPLHEANGEWSWWYYERGGAETYKELFRYVVNYLKEHGLDGQFLTAFAPNGNFNGDESRYKLLYPGDDVVDVLSMDSYDTNNALRAKDKWAGELVEDMAMLARMAEASGKLAAVAEFGREGDKVIRPDGNKDLTWYTDVLEAIKANPDAAKIAYMMTWANFGGSPVFSAFTPWPGHEMADNFREFVKQMTMTRNADRDITVDVTIQHGTTDDGDIKTTTKQVTIPKGQNSATFTIDAVADGKQEGDENYTVKISNAQGGQIETGKDSVTTTIHDEGHASPANRPGSISISGEAKEDTTLTATVQDEDGVPNNVAYQWLRDGKPIDGAHNKTYVLRPDDVGHKISVRATYQDNAAHDEAPTSSETDAVVAKQAQPQQNHAGTVSINGTLKVGETLTAAVADEDGVPKDVQYQWLRDGQPISGGTGERYQLTADDAGHKISVQAFYQDKAQHNENPVSAQSEVSKDATPPTGNFHDDFSAYPTGSEYAQGTTFGQWNVVQSGYGHVKIVDNGGGNNALELKPKAQSGQTATSSTEVIGPQHGDEFIFSGTISTPEQLRQGATPNAWETAWLVWNYTDNDHFYYFVPRANGWELGKRDPAYAGGQRFLATGSEGWPLADSKQFTISKQGGTIEVKINGKVIATVTDDDQPYNGNGRIGIYSEDARVLADDIDLSGKATIEGTTNHLGSIKLDSSGNTFTAIVEDKDEIVGTITYQWYSRGQPIAGATGQSYTLKDGDKEITVRATYTDKNGHVESVLSPLAAGDNHPGSVTLAGEAKVGATLTANVSDADGVPADVQYTWLRDGSPITGASGNTYTLQAADIGHKISVQAYYKDSAGHEENHVISAPTVSVTDGATPPPATDPHAGAITVSGAAKVGAVLTTAITDADGVPKTGIHYQWYADGKAIDGATHEVYRIRPDDIGKHISVQASYTDNGGHAETTNTAAVVQNVADNPATQSAHGHKLYAHEEFGKYIDARDFGVNPANADNTAALKAALKAADDEGAALYLGAGTLKLHEQIRIGADVHDKSGKLIQEGYENVRAIFGAGAGETHLTFDWQQTEGERFYPRAKDDRFNPWNNRTNVNPYAAILIDGVNGKSVADLSLEYQHKTAEDFYQKTKSYFGLINGIIVNDADNTKIDTVEVSGANRAGVYFTSTLAETSGARDKLKTHQISEADVPTGDNNQLIYSNLHHNRVAGALVAYQKNFTADSNHLAWNGHEADGGTGYGIASMAGSYGFGITYSRNTTDHNYRKGLDIHDGNHITIEDNTLNGDRLHGIVAYNRQYTMDDVTIRRNHITADPNFRLAEDDGDEIAGGTPNYHLYSGIQLQTNTQPTIQDLQSKGPGKFDISDNTISGMALYRNAQQTYGIEFRNQEPEIDYTLNIRGNHISGESTQYGIAIINNTIYKNRSPGKGSGDIAIEDNTIDYARNAGGGAPLYLEEKNADGHLRGSVKINHNALTLREASDGNAEAISMTGNAKTYDVGHNTFELHGNIGDRPVIRMSGHGTNGSDKVHLNLHDNTFQTDTGKFDAAWLKGERASIDAQHNTLNGKALDDNHASYQHEPPLLQHDSDTYHLSAETALHYPMPVKHAPYDSLHADHLHGLLESRDGEHHSAPAAHAPYDSLEADHLHGLLENHGGEQHSAPAAHAPYDSLEADHLHGLLESHGGEQHSAPKTPAAHYDSAHHHLPAPLPQEEPYTIF